MSFAVAPDAGKIVLHADDLGMNEAVDSGIVEGFRDGLLTSAAVLANGPTAANAVAALSALNAAGSPRSSGRVQLSDPDEPYDLGVHLNLTQGRPLTGNRFPAALLDEQGAFVPPARLVVRLARAPDAVLVAVREELATQIAFVVDQGRRPTHLNGHQYIEVIPAVANMLPELMRRFAIRVVRCPRERLLTAGLFTTASPVAWGKALVVRTLAASMARRVKLAGGVFADEFLGAGQAGRIRLTALRRRLKSLGGQRLMEVALHPGATPLVRSQADAELAWTDPLATRRPEERDLVCSTDLLHLLSGRGVQLSRLALLA